MIHIKIECFQITTLSQVHDLVTVCLIVSQHYQDYMYPVKISLATFRNVTALCFWLRALKNPGQNKKALKPSVRFYNESWKGPIDYKAERIWHAVSTGLETVGTNICGANASSKGQLREPCGPHAPDCPTKWGAYGCEYIQSWASRSTHPKME